MAECLGINLEAQLGFVVNSTPLVLKYSTVADPESSFCTSTSNCSAPFPVTRRRSFKHRRRFHNRGQICA